MAFWKEKAIFLTGLGLPGVSLILRPLAMKLRVSSMIFESVILAILRKLTILSIKNVDYLQKSSIIRA